MWRQPPKRPRCRPKAALRPCWEKGGPTRASAPSKGAAVLCFRFRPRCTTEAGLTTGLAGSVGARAHRWDPALGSWSWFHLATASQAAAAPLLRGGSRPPCPSRARWEAPRQAVEAFAGAVAPPEWAACYFHRRFAASTDDLGYWEARIRRETVVFPIGPRARF
jgi:hypothetical protein